VSNVDTPVDLDEARQLVEPGARQGVPVDLLAWALIHEVEQLRAAVAAKAEELVAGGWLPPDQVEAFAEAEMTRGARLGSQATYHGVVRAGWRAPEQVRQLLAGIVATIQGMEPDDRPEVMAARHACASIVEVVAAAVGGRVSG
jgi:hypothetical protein